MTKIPAAKFVTTKHSKRVVLIETASADLIGVLRGKVRVTGDITSTGLGWNAVPLT